MSFSTLLCFCKSFCSFIFNYVLFFIKLLGIVYSIKCFCFQGFLAVSALCMLSIFKQLSLVLRLRVVLNLKDLLQRSFQAQTESSGPVGFCGGNFSCIPCKFLLYFFFLDEKYSF